MDEPRAVSIAEPLWRSLMHMPFRGTVIGRFQHACNLIESNGRLIALTLPSIGNGPFSIVVDAAPHWFDQWAFGQTVYINATQMTWGVRQIGLRDASQWVPTVPIHLQENPLEPQLIDLFRPYLAWPHTTSTTPLALVTNRLLQQAAQSVQTALAQSVGVVKAIQQLVGLGPGLTPAGDDYLLGVMAGLWMFGDHTVLPIIAAACKHQTTHLSGMFLAAASQGQFMEAWHDLDRALDITDISTIQSALDRIAAFGASSGRDALAGFAAFTINAQHHPAPSSTALYT